MSNSSLLGDNSSRYGEQHDDVDHGGHDDHDDVDQDGHVGHDDHDGGDVYDIGFDRAQLKLLIFSAEQGRAEAGLDKTLFDIFILYSRVFVFQLEFCIFISSTWRTRLII